MAPKVYQVSQSKRAARHIEDGLEQLAILEADERIRGNPEEWSTYLRELMEFAVSAMLFLRSICVDDVT